MVGASALIDIYYYGVVLFDKERSLRKKLL
jgi:hypothetical protein